MEGDSPYFLGMATDDAFFLAAGQIPDAHRLIDAARRAPASIRGQGYPANRILVPIEFFQLANRADRTFSGETARACGNDVDTLEGLGAAQTAQAAGGLLVPVHGPSLKIKLGRFTFFGRQLPPGVGECELSFGILWFGQILGRQGL